MTLKEISSVFGTDAKLLKQYFLAFTNLYGICPLQKAKSIINRQNPAMKLTDEQILGFADNYNGDWKIVSQSEVYSNVYSTVPMRRDIVNKLLVFYGDYSGYVYVQHGQADKDYYIPEKEELLRYAVSDYLEQTQYTKAMEEFLEKELHADDFRRRLIEICLNLQLDSFDIQTFIGSLGETLPDTKTAEKAVSIYVELNNNTRSFVNRGFTPKELSQKYNLNGALPSSISFGPGMQKMIQNGQLDADELTRGFTEMNISQELRNSLISETDKAKQSKPGRNDPCPCGSGKKYKKCCGR